jgi:hypothetical protein
MGYKKTFNFKIISINVIYELYFKSTQDIYEYR